MGRSPPLHAEPRGCGNRSKQGFMSLFLHMRQPHPDTPGSSRARHDARPTSRAAAQRAFLIAMGLLTALFLTLLLLGNAGNQTDVLYLGGRDFQADMLNTEVYARALNPYGYDPSGAHVPFKDANYPPLAYVLFYFCDALSLHDVATPWAMAVSLCLAALGVLLLLIGVYRLTGAPTRGRRALLAAAIALSAPTVYAFERGNIILLAVTLCVLFLLGYQSPRPLLRELSFCALAMAAALKIYPALLGLLLLSQRRYRDALRLMLYGLAFVFLPFLCIEGGFANLPLLMENFGAHAAFYTRRIYPRFGFRLFSSIAYDAPFANAFLNDNLWKLGEKLDRVMPGVDALLCLGCASCALLGRRPFERVLGVMLILVNYPVNSGYYTALYLLPALSLLLGEAVWRRGDWATLFLLVAIVQPVQLPLPYGLFGITEPILCNLTDILRNLAAYALFVRFAVTGVLALVGTLRHAKGIARGSAAAGDPQILR